jgi:anti-sigma factor RsiW
MNCAELEILICDYVDGTLPEAQKAVVESHLQECPACAALAHDSAEAVAFMERASDVEPPPELITRILYQAPRGPAVRSAGERGWLRRLFAPVLQPRFVMSAAMTVLSFSMFTRFVPVRQLKPSDLRPSEVWASLDDRSHRVWARTVKYYENLKVVYQIQTLLRDWQQQSEDRKPATPAPKTDDRKLPVKTPNTDGRPNPNPSGGSQ